MMNIQKLSDTVNLALESNGYKSTIVSAEHIIELRKTIEENLNSGQIKKEVYNNYKSSFDNMLTQDTQWVRSIIVVAAPSPILEVIFTIDGEEQSTIIPPTYEHSIDETVTNIIESILFPHGYQISRASLPQKLLASQSGLARYGKNNIAYVDGMGSFYRLIAFYSDLPCLSDNWQEPQLLEQCIKCKACANKCPSGAIDPNQFQLRAERCLTFHNESNNNFPTWIQKTWHHCLVGCMKCQHYCPVNRSVRSWKEKYAEFSEYETQLLLNGTDIKDIPIDIVEKFKNTNLLEEPKNFGRNLRSVLYK